MTRNRGHEAKRRIAEIQRHPVFAGCTRQQLAEIDQLGAGIEVAAGRTLIREGTVGRECLITLDGTAVAWHDDRPIGTIGPGSVIGEMALLGHVRRSASVVAATPMRLLVLEGREFERLLTIAPSAGAALERIAIDRRRQSEPPAVASGGVYQDASADESTSASTTEYRTTNSRGTFWQFD